jgi:D-alanyl-D-alanine dipeptidase
MKIIPYISFLSFMGLLVLQPKSMSFRESEKGIVQDTVKEWAEINFEVQGIQNRMAYADTANFMHQKIYPCARCFLRPEVAEALEEANQIAKDKGYTLVIYDCYRPYGYQKVMYDIVNDPRYVAPPGKGSNHNRGRAVDLSLADENGNLLDMGTPFDDFTEQSNYDADGLTREARRNRRVLKNIMKKAGFSPYSHEWWHFDYKKQNYETADFRWDCK